MVLLHVKYILVNCIANNVVTHNSHKLLTKEQKQNKNTLVYKRNRKKIATVPFKSKLTLDSQSSHESRIESRHSILYDYVSILD